MTENTVMTHDCSDVRWTPCIRAHATLENASGCMDCDGTRLKFRGLSQECPCKKRNIMTLCAGCFNPVGEKRNGCYSSCLCQCRGRAPLGSLYELEAWLDAADTLDEWDMEARKGDKRMRHFFTLFTSPGMHRAEGATRVEAIAMAVCKATGSHEEESKDDVS